MLLLNEERKKWMLCRHPYDMAACCYDAILKQNLPEPVFISQYMDAGGVLEMQNPNLKLLTRLGQEIRHLLRADVWESAALKGKIWDAVEKSCGELERFGSEEGNIASVFMTVLQTIDSVTSEKVKRHQEFECSGPLNHRDNFDCLVYLKNNQSLLEKMKGAYKFRSPVVESGISSSLQALSLMRRSEWDVRCGYPVVKPFYIHEGRTHLRRSLDRSKRIRIALFPDVVPRRFDFNTDNCPGSSFRVTYGENEEADIAQHCRWLKYAVEQGANFIIFSEFFISAKILEGMKDWLRKEKGEGWMKNSALLAVFAGSTWSGDDNNVMHILDWKGDELGVYYKYSSFTSVPRAKVENGLETENTYDMCERLTTPGKECMLLDMDILGRLLPSICRDVIDGKYTEKMVTCFEPFLVMTAAYSESVASFERHFSHYASCHYATSVLCNACDATKKGKNLSICTVPVKQDTKMEGRSVDIPKCATQRQDCGNSCCVLLELDYMPDASGKNNIGIPKGPTVTYHRTENLPNTD